MKFTAKLCTLVLHVWSTCKAAFGGKSRNTTIYSSANVIAYMAPHTNLSSYIISFPITNSFHKKFNSSNPFTIPYNPSLIASDALKIPVFE